MRYLVLILLGLFLASNVLGQRGRISDADFDEEDLRSQKRWSHFHFDDSDKIMIGAGVLMLVIGIGLQSKSKPGDEGCLAIALIFIGVICVWPLISAILSLFTLILKIILLGGLIIAAAAFVFSHFQKKE